MMSNSATLRKFLNLFLCIAVRANMFAREHSDFLNTYKKRAMQTLAKDSVLAHLGHSFRSKYVCQLTSITSSVL